MLEQGIQIVGAATVLAAYLSSQLGWLETRSLAYLLPNLVGSIALAIVAWLTGQPGFLLLEGVWAIVTAHTLLRGLSPQA